MIDSTPGTELVEIRRTRLTKPRLRALFVTSMWPDRVWPHYGPFVASQARSLEARGIAVDVLVIRGYASRRAYAVARPRLLRLVRETAPQIIHVHTGHAAVVSLLRLGQPKVISFVGGDLLGHPDEQGVTRKSRIEATVFRRLAHFADATITKSDEMERTLPRRLRTRNSVIPNGVDLDFFRPRDRIAARTTLGWSQDDQVALFLGDPDDPRKNVALARQALTLLTERGRRVRLHVAWGALPQDVPTLMAASDALILSSLSEGSPNVVKEAMACALPVVATPVGDVPERLRGVEGCFVVDAQPTAFAGALECALRLTGAPAARDAVLDLGLDAVAERVERVYSTVI